MATPEQARRLGRPVGYLGGRFMMDPAGFARAPEVGLEPGLGVYVAGRFGVLGRVDADVVAAAAAFWNPQTIRTHWDAALAAGDPREISDWYAGICADHGRAHLADAAGLDRWCELAGRAVDAAPVPGAPTFAGWRAVALPGDLPGRAYQLTHVLRELRFGLHVSAAVVSGLGPALTVRTTPGMDALMPVLGWPEPYPEPTEADTACRDDVEATTDELHAAALVALTDDEVEEMIGLVEALAG